MGKKEKDEFDEEDEDTPLDEYDSKQEKDRIKSLGLEESSKQSFDLLSSYHDTFQKDEEERRKKAKDERKPFLL